MLTGFLTFNPSFKSSLQKDKEVIEQMKEFISTKRLSQCSVGTAKPEPSISKPLNQEVEEEEEGLVDPDLEAHLDEERQRLEYLYRERLKKWEARENALVKERRREQERYEDLLQKKDRARQALAGFIEKFDFDEDLPPRHEAEKMFDFTLVPDGHLILDHYYKRHDTSRRFHR